MGRLYRRSLQGGDRVKTRRIWRLLDLDRTNIVNMQITKWNKFDTSQSRETQVCSIYWRFWDLDCAGSRWKSCRGVMLRRGNQGGQLLLGNCVEHLEPRWFDLIGKGQRWDKTFKRQWVTPWWECCWWTRRCRTIQSGWTWVAAGAGCSGSSGTWKPKNYIHHQLSLSFTDLWAKYV